MKLTIVGWELLLLVCSLLEFFLPLDKLCLPELEIPNSLLQGGKWLVEHAFPNLSATVQDSARTCAIIQSFLLGVKIALSVILWYFRWHSIVQSTLITVTTNKVMITQSRQIVHTPSQKRLTAMLRNGTQDAASPLPKVSLALSPISCLWTDRHC